MHPPKLRVSTQYQLEEILNRGKWRHTCERYRQKHQWLIRGSYRLWLLSDLKWPPCTDYSQWTNEKWRVNKLRCDRPTSQAAALVLLSALSSSLGGHLSNPICRQASCSRSLNSDMLVKTIMYTNKDLMMVMITCQTYSISTHVHMLHHTSSKHPPTRTLSFQMSLVAMEWTWFRMRLGRVTGSPVQSAVEECQAK